MSEAVTEAPITEAPAPEAPVADGGSFLNDVANAPLPEEPAPAEGSAEQAFDQAVFDGQRPEHIPEKFWDGDKRMAKVDEMGKAYSNLEKLMSSQDRITLPTGDDDEEGHERLYAALRPKEADNYDFGDRPEMPEGLQYDEEGESSYRNLAFANGLSPKQARGVYDGYVKLKLQEHAAYAKARAEQREQLNHAMQREYGDGLNAAVRRAGTTMEKYADPDFRAYLNETGLGNDPRMIRFMERVGKDMNGETRLQGRPQAQAMPQDLDKAIAEFNSKYEKQLFDPTHPDHKRLVDERSKLFEARFPEMIA